MRSKISLKWSLLTIGIAVIVSGAAIIFFTTPNLFNRNLKLVLPIGNQASQNLVDNKAVDSIQGIDSGEQVNSELPVRLKIPIINVDAAFEYVGLTPDGAMDVPKGPANVAWFNLGPRPGEIGSSVIAGHYSWKKGVPAAFDNLHKLRKGDKIYIETDKGSTISFVVRETRRYDPKANAPEVFGSNDGKSHLNLITCEGEWDKTSKTYFNLKRLVVFTDRE